MNDLTGKNTIHVTPDEDEHRIKGVSKDLVAAHHAGDLNREIQLVIALESLYFRNGRFEEAEACRMSLVLLRHAVQMKACGITVIEMREVA